MDALMVPWYILLASIRLMWLLSLQIYTKMVGNVLLSVCIVEFVDRMSGIREGIG